MDRESRRHVQRVIKLVPMTPTERRIELVRAWASASGYTAHAFGRITNPQGTTLTTKGSRGHRVQVAGWADLASITYYQKRALDWATGEIASGWTFEGLTRAKGNYRPTLRLDVDWRCVVLAQEYDRWQKMVNDPRRAYTVGFSFDGTDRFRLTISDHFAWDGKRLLIGEPPKWWQVRMEGEKDGRVDSLANWIGTFATGGFTVQERPNDRVMVAFEHNRDAVVFRLTAEQSPWKGKALRIRVPTKPEMGFLLAA